MLIAVPLGIIVVNMNEAGFFDTPKYSIKMLVHNINDFRRLDEDMIKKLEDEERQENRGE